MLKGKKILLGITASIAAYKAAFLIRLFVKAGAEVKVLMTPASKDFVTPLTLATLSKNPVSTEFIENDEEGTWSNHVELGLWADLMLIAPATANTMAKMTSGVCDNLLMAVYLSAKCPVYIAPAMDLDMFRHPSTVESLDKLQSFGNRIIPAGTGELASGLEGEGRMAEPEEIISFMVEQIRSESPFHGKKILVNAGPTYERIDKVRFIGNFSSGKMGVAIAREAVNLGAEVTLVLGPAALNFDLSGMEVIRVESANEMLEACESGFDDADVAILSAAVADYRPKQFTDGKIKKSHDDLQIELVKNPDILKILGSRKDKQVLVGFALENEKEEEYAKEKLKNKNADLIVLNSLQTKGAGFGIDTNQVNIYDREGLVITSELLPKKRNRHHYFKRCSCKT